MRAGVGRLLRRLVPAQLKTVVPVRTRARLPAWAGLDVFPDLAVRHALFRSPEYRALRHAARGYDEQKRDKPIVERPHQASFLIARWLAAAGTRSAFHVGYAGGRYLFHLGRVGIVAGGTDLPGSETYWTERVAARLEPGVAPRLRPSTSAFSEATFETLLPWREGRGSVPKYGEMDADALRELMLARFPDKVAELAGCLHNFAFIAPGAGRRRRRRGLGRLRRDACPTSSTACGCSRARSISSSGSRLARRSARSCTPAPAIAGWSTRWRPTPSASARSVLHRAGRISWSRCT